MNDGRIRRTVLMVALLTGCVMAATALPPISVGMSTAASTLDGESVGQATVAGSVRIARWFDLQLTATAIHPLERSYEDAAGRSYQSETAWTGIGFRPFVSLGESVEIGFPLRTGNGLIQFRYERPYRDEVDWTEEILDRETIAVNSAGVDVTVAISERWNVVIEAGGRVSSPIRMTVPVEKDALNGWYAGIGATYRLEGNP